MKTTKECEVRARVESYVVTALDLQARTEHIERPDIIRRAIMEYLAKRGSPVIAALNGRNLEGD